jgi:hypothetical protein
MPQGEILQLDEFSRTRAKLSVRWADEAGGFRRGRKLEKIVCEAQGTTELFFDDV